MSDPSTLFSIAVPKQFDFANTVSILQRGIEDPINKFAEGRWTRCFMIDLKPVVLSVHHDKKLHIQVIAGEAPEESIKQIVKHSLGLDDPLLKPQEFAIKYIEKIKAVWCIAVPGYPSLYEAIIQTIFGQLVSVLVANKQRKIFVETFGKDFEQATGTYKQFPEPQDIAHLPLDQLRSLGFGNTKSKAILEVSQRFRDDNLGNLLQQALHRQHVDELLYPIHGIGRWTIDWVALRALRHFDVIPASDLAVRNAFTWWLSKKEILSVDAVDKFYKKFYPYGGAVTYRILCAYTAFKKQSKSILI